MVVKILFFLILQLTTFPLMAENVEIDIGGTPMAIPSPTGFLPVTGFTINQFFDRFVTPKNIRFISFVPANFVPAIQRGEIPALTRNLSVQTVKELAGATMAKADFEQLKREVRVQSEEIAKELEKQAPGMMNTINQGLKDDFKQDLNLKINDFIMLPPHAEDDRSFAFSELVKYSAKSENGSQTNISGTVTATFLFSKAKVFFIYANGNSGDLQWTRQISKDWAAAILAANPSDLATAEKESVSPQGFDWNQVFRSSLLGGIIGGLYGLGRYLVRRFKTG